PYTTLFRSKWDAHSHFGVGSRRRRSNRATMEYSKATGSSQSRAASHSLRRGSRPSTYVGAPEDGSAVGACPVGKAVSNRIFQAPPSRRGCRMLEDRLLLHRGS